MLEAVTCSQFSGAFMARRLHAAQVFVVPKRWGIFQVSALSDLVLTQARLEVYRSGERAPADDLESGAIDATALPRMFGLQRVGGLVVYGFEYLLVRDGTPIARMEAARGTADARGHGVVLRAFRLTHLPSGRTVTADRAVWRPGAGEIEIRGEYTIASGDAISHGRGLRLDAEQGLDAAPR